MTRGPKLSYFKIMEPNLQNDKNRGTKTGTKPYILFFICWCRIIIYELVCHHVME
jgi:hypothetical protein